MISIQLMVAFTALAAVVTIGMVVLMISDSREQRRRREIIEAKLAVLKFDDGDDEATLKEAVKHAPEPKYV